MSPPSPKSLPAAPTPRPEFVGRLPSGFRHIAGVDEAGRGPWAGPVVAAAVVLHRAPLPAHITDSKRLTNDQRERAFLVIVQFADVGIGIVPADEIDRRNILQATLHAMRQAVLDLPRLPRMVLVDGRDALALAIPSRAIVRGDLDCYPISCASIVAKVVRDRLMRFYDRLYPGYAFHQHKGYGTPQHTAALKAQGVSMLHRLSFRPISEHPDVPIHCQTP